MVFEQPIETDRLTLRLVREGDRDAMHAMRSREDVNRYLFTEASSLEQTQALIAKSVALAVDQRTDGRLIGEVSLWLRSAEHRQGEVGAVFHPDYHGGGYALEAMRALLDLAFGPAGMHRVAGTAEPANDRSITLMRRLGMRQEGLMRENAWFKGRWGDEAVYAILEDEWRARAR